MEGNLAGAINLNGATDQPILGSVNLVGQGVQILPAAGPSWPARPSEFAFSSAGSWAPKEKTFRWDSLQSSLGAKGQVQDFTLTLNRPTVFRLGESKLPPMIQRLCNGACGGWSWRLWLPGWFLPSS